MPRKPSNILLTIFFLLYCVPAFAQASVPKAALIIGNSDYPNSNAVKNPENDAASMAAALSKLGFEVASGVNQNKQQTERLIETFAGKLAQNKGVGLFFYAGIGFHSGGENYLVPVDADFTNEEETVKTSVTLNALLTKLKAAGNELNLILLDATLKTKFQSLWRNRPLDSKKVGFITVSPGYGTLIFYSAEAGRTAFERCGENGYFVASILKQLEKSKLEFSELAKNVSEDVASRTNREQKPFVKGFQTRYFYLTGDVSPVKVEAYNLLERLYNEFRSTRKCPCGQRDEALSIAKEIIEKFGDDEHNRPLIDFIRKDVQKSEKEEPVCRRNERYNASYRNKNWGEFWALSKSIIDEEGDSPLALDVMLTLVSVGYERAAVDKVDAYNADTIFYAKEAIRRIEAGGTSFFGNWGIFMPFKTSSFPDGKSNALSWMHYIIGWFYINRLGATDAGKKKEGLVYLYKSTLYKGDNQRDHSIYTNIGDFYAAEATKLNQSYRVKLAAVKNQETRETKRLLGLAKGYFDRALDAFARARRIAEKNIRPKTIESFNKRIAELYRLRFDLAADAPTPDLEKFVANLIGKPMPSPETKIEPVWQ
ncbi:MAG TPA: caspase family protein [Pyrinomonadaceae bacterium]|jgi:hypothetical protein